MWVGAVRWESELWVLGSFCVHTSVCRAASNACGCVRAHMCPEVQSRPVSSQRSPAWRSGKGAALPRPQSQQMVGKGTKRDSPPPSTASSTDRTGATNVDVTPALTNHKLGVFGHQQ